MLETLLEAAADPSERVREWAAQFLGRVEEPQAREPLETLVETDGSDVVRVTAAKALTGTHRPDAIRAVDRPADVGSYDPLNTQPDL